MNIQALTTAESMICPDTGAMLRRSVRRFTVRYKGEAITVDLAGYHPEGDGDGVLVGEDMAPAEAALRQLKEQVDGLPSPGSINRLRTRLKLSQREAGAVFRVGPNAFQKYERGLIEPSGPTAQLMRLLDRHPELVEELRSRVPRSEASV